MKVLKQYAEEIVEVALARANAKNPPFASDHEGIAVLFEEIQEAIMEMNAIKRNVECTWSCVKTDRHDDSLEYIKKVERHAVNLIAEASQVAAMCRKYGLCAGKEEQ